MLSDSPLSETTGWLFLQIYVVEDGHVLGFSS